MKLWKKTVALMLTTLLCSLVLVGGLSLFLTGKRGLENTAQTYGRQLEAAASLMEQFWDGSQYSLMSDTGKVTGEEALEFLEGIGLQGFQICSEYHDTLPGEGKNGPVARDGFTFERVVDGVPVNYITESLLPVYEDGTVSVNGDEAVAEGEDLIWMQEELSIEFAGGTVRIFQYRDGLEISDLSDEKQFLLPFEEIRDIFERTVALQMMTEEDRYSQACADMFGASVYNVDSVDMTVTKVKLGYMRQRDNLSNKKGFLIPVWDFYGVWTAELTNESGIASSSMEADDFPILTLDARDGTVIQRFLGY